MRIDVAKHAGFCFGVKRAVELAEEVLGAERGDPAYSLGEIIHNPQTVARLADLGLTSVSSVDEIPGGVLVIRSHGLPPETIQLARDRGLALVDATCPYVHRAQTLASKLADEGYQVLIVGDEAHPEVQALVAHTGYRARVVASPVDLDGMDLEGEVAVIAQTTQPIANVESCVRRLRELGHSPVVKKTTCTATDMRQAEAAAMAKTHQVMLVIGGRRSANTTKLAAICQEAGARTYHVETASELKPEWFRGAASAGVTAGASTPDWIIEEVVERMTEFEGSTPETDQAEERAQLAPSPAEEVPIGPKPDAMTDAITEIVPGAKIKGRVSKVEADQVYVDIGGKTDGVIPLRELSHRNLPSAQGILEVGDEVDIVVLRAENENGEAVLSKRRADAELAWQRLTEAHQSGSLITARVVERVKGGLVVDLGVRGFIPGSQVSKDFVPDLDGFVGKELACKVLELDEAKHSAVLSHRVVDEEEARHRKEAAFQRFKVGEVYTGKVKRLTTFGAFVDIGDVEGLLHVSELAWGRVQKPADVLSEGDEIKVKVLRIDTESGRVALSLRQALPDPWEAAKHRYREGEIVEGEVVRVADFGAFVRLEDGIEGLVHISQLADERIAKASDAVKPGDQVKVKILSFDAEQKRVSLSRKQALPPKPRREEVREIREAHEDLPVREEAPPVTLGDMFGTLFEEKLKK